MAEGAEDTIQRQVAADITRAAVVGTPVEAVAVIPEAAEDTAVVEGMAAIANKLGDVRL
jgi:hypothetical protein